MGLKYSEAASRKALTTILFNTIITIRAATEEESPKKKIYKLANLVHNLPLIFTDENDASGTKYQKEFAKFTERAEILGLKPWVDSILEKENNR